MEDRNRYTKQTSYNGFKSYATSKIFKTPTSTDDLYIISRERDRLDSLAYEFYGDARFWILIAEANNLGKGSFAIPPGRQIRIPSRTFILEVDNVLQRTEDER